MSSEAILQIIFAIIILNYLVDLLSGLLNYNSFNNKLPENVSDIYNDKEYLKSQEYKKENFRFNLITSSFSFIILIVVLYNGYFGTLDSIIRNYTFENEISPSILFFFAIYFINDFISIPFQLYRVFVIEEKYGFNNMKIRTYIFDKIKGYFLTIVIGLILLVPVLVLILLYPQNFWIYAWILLSAFMIFLNMFYTSLIVPLFNKLAPLEDGDLRKSLNEYASNVGFSLSTRFLTFSRQNGTEFKKHFAKMWALDLKHARLYKGQNFVAV